MDRPLKYRVLLKILRKYGIDEDTKRGKGSERMLVGVVGGVFTRHPIKCHGEGDEKPKAVVASVRRIFGLTPERGISDREFYG